MKNQYFGDINNYRKHGLLRSINQVSELRLLGAWMLTPDEGSTKGKFTTYLESAQRGANSDPVLVRELAQIRGWALTRSFTSGT